MTGGNNNNDNNSVIHTVIHTDKNSKRETNQSRNVLHDKIGAVRIVKSVSVRPESFKLLKTFLTIIKREHISFSDGVLWAIKEFIPHHNPPNPQPTLDRMFKVNSPAKPNTICFVPECRAKSRYQLILKNYKGEKETFNVCGRHKRWRHDEFKFIVRMKEVG